MSYYELLLFAHLVFAMTWVGGDLMIQLFYLRARAASPEAVAQFTKSVEWIGLRVINPTALLVAIFGALLVIEVDGYEFSQFWISAALAMFLASALTGAAFLGPESGRIGKLMEERGPADPEVQSRIARILLVSRIELVLLILIVLDMVVKPGFP
ncbi:MAG: DUF2269 family protein [Solirubrobacterales bacterium]